jgi:hypothetical protein
MVPQNESDDGEDPDGPGQAAFVYCPECGAKASASWSFCRNCEQSLDDAVPADNLVSTEDGLVDLMEGRDGSEGCPKCGHTDAEVDDIATTGTGLSRLFDIQNRRYRAVTCTRCGYTEFYKGRTPSEVVDLFIG